MDDDALETLGARPGNSYDVVHKKYKNLALRHHPNKGGDGEQFKKIQEAWNLLKNLKNSWNGAIPGTPDENIFETHLRAMRKVGVDRRNSYRNALAKFDAFDNKSNANVKKTKTFMKQFLNDEAWPQYMSEIMKNAYDASNRTSSMPYPEGIFQNDLSKKPETQTNNNGKNTQTNNNNGTRTTNNNKGTRTANNTNKGANNTNETRTANNNKGTRTANNMKTNYSLSGNGIIQNNLSMPTNYGLSGNSIIQNNLTKNNVPMPKNMGPMPKTNNMPKNMGPMPKPNAARRPTVGLIERLFGVGRKTPLVDDRIFGAKILVGDDLYEYALDSSGKTMIRIFATKKAARREMEFIARADPRTVPRVYEMFKHYPSGRYVIFMERLYFDGPLRCADVARIQKIVESLHSRGIAHYCIDGKHLGRRGGKGPLVVFGFEHAVQFGKPVTPRDHDRVMRRDSRPLSDLNGPILLTSVLCR